MRRPMVLRLVAHRKLQEHVLNPLHWSTDFRIPVRASKGTKRRSRAHRRQASSLRRQPPGQGWFRVPPPAMLLRVQLAALLAPRRVLPGQRQQESRKVDRREAHREGQKADLWEGRLEVPMVGQRVVLWEGRSAGRRGGRSVGHWAALWWVRARRRALLLSPQRVKVARCHQTLPRACRRVVLARLHHGTVLQKFSVSPCIHPYRPHGAA